MARLKEKYRKEAVPRLMEICGYKNVMQVPRMVKIVVNMGLNSTVEKDVVKTLVRDLATITGQMPVICLARKSIANFKLREGMPVGAMVTLRGARMYEFLVRLVNIALPRVRDFKGVSPKGFDGRGNFTLGLRDQLMFLEIDYMRVDKTRGMNVSVCTTAKTDQEARDLLEIMGVPFRKQGS